MGGCVIVGFCVFVLVFVCGCCYLLWVDVGDDFGCGNGCVVGVVGVGVVVFVFWDWVVWFG